MNLDVNKYEDLFKKPKISVLLPAYKSGKLLKEIFIPSFVQNTVENVELLIWDNGGNEEHLNSSTKLYFNNLRVFGNGENLGLNKALNLLAKEAKGEYFYLCHTDMHLLPGWDTALLTAAKNLPPTSFLFTSRSIEKASHIPMQLLKDFGTNLDNFNKEGLEKFFKEEYKDKGIVTGYRMPFFGHIDLLKKMHKYNKENNICDGPFDESYFSFATDDDLFITAYNCSVRRFWMINESVVYHLSGHSNNQQNVDKDSQKPYDYLRNKWSKKHDMNGPLDVVLQKICPWNLEIK